MLSLKFLVLTLIGLIIAFSFTLDTFEPLRSLISKYLPISLSKNISQNAKLFTKDELSQFRGAGNSKVYISILGDVFDVTRGRKHYGEGGGYHFFSGKDGTRAFVTGKFTDEGLIEDTAGLSHTDLLGLEEWNNFYKKDYTFLGHLIGLYYDTEGKPTDAMRDFQQRLGEAKKAKLSDEDDRNMYPPCNFEYKQGQGRRIWCSTLSGGVKREWEGVPRQYFQPGKTDPRCACVRASGPPTGADPRAPHNNRGDMDNPLMKLYEDCDPMSVECSFKE